MEYQSPKGYFYKETQNGGFKRIPSYASTPKPGMKVEIIIKPYHKKVLITGIIKDVLTKKKYHSRGHKVRLIDGKIGRIVKVF
jgi:uncharacterized repeat protein (TIGR03833 family)